ncbi:MAG TPA: PqqD family protein [Acidimicrobiales bacterium]|nr:PqqD family protein [Acidimicrobiales bacterium]
MADPTPTDRVDDDFVPRAKPSVASVELDGERVLYDTEGGRLHRLDPVGSLVWACFDGRSPVGELAADLAAGFGADLERVRSDVVELVTTLVDEGLLETGDGEAEGHEAEQDANPQGIRDEPTVLTDPPGG